MRAALGASLEARPPTAKQDGQIGRADSAVAVEVGGVARVRSPRAEQEGQIECAHRAVAVLIGWAKLMFEAAHIDADRFISVAVDQPRVVVEIGVAGFDREIRISGVDRERFA